MTRALQLLDAVLRHPAKAAQMDRSIQKGIVDFRNYHLPFIASYCILIFASPYLWYQLFTKTTAIHRILTSTMKTMLIAPLSVILFLVFIGLYDRFTENRISPTSRIEPPDPIEHNRGLFLSIPVSASLLFFLLHPLLGFLMLAISIAYSTAQIIRVQSFYENVSIQKTTARFLAFTVFFLLPLVAVLLVYNLSLTIRIFLNLI